MKRILMIIGGITIVCVVLGVIGLFASLGKNSASTASKGKVSVTLMAPQKPPTTTPPKPTIQATKTALVAQPTAEPVVTTTPENTVVGFKDGFYLVNKDIQPGIYRSTGSGGRCWWARQNENQESIRNHYGMAGVAIAIAPEDFQVELKDCGVFIPLEAVPVQPDEVQRAAHGDGFYLVGYDIAPGVWRSDGSGDRCWWARSDKALETIRNSYGMAGGTMTIQPEDFQVELKDCGNWTLIS